MKTLKMKQLDEKDEEIADTLIILGMSRNEAMTLSYMQNTNSASTIELERAARLRQPEVSIAMKQLKERDRVNEQEECPAIYKRVVQGRYPGAFTTRN